MLSSLLKKSSRSITSSPVWSKRLYSVDKNNEDAMPRNYRSSLFIPIRENVTKETKSLSHRYLLKSGFIRQSASGIYSYLPLGLRVLEKLTKIIDEEMKRVGGQKLSMPIMMTAELWRTTGRWDKNGSEMIKFKDRKGEEYCLGPTHEELITQIVANDVFSYKNLPLRLYQIGEKFRDEVRPRHGLIRCREFIMKDMYSFDATQELALKTYEELVKAYHRIMKRIGIPYVVAEADTGNIGGDLSHEFHIPAALGDDTLLKCNCCGYAGNVEKARHKAVDTPLPVTHIDSFNNFEDIIKIFANPEHPSEIKCSVFKVDGNKRCILFHHRDREPNSYAVKNGVKNIEEVEDEFPDMNKILSTPPENRIILFDDSLMGHQNAIREEIQKIESIAKTATTHEVRWGQFHKTRQGDKCPQENCNGTLEESKGIEIGHCFYLGKKYSSVLDAKIRNADQTQTVLEMGCYGIGVSRLISAISESQHDQKGVTWPFSVAPYRVTILPFKTEFNEVADQVYDILEQDSDFKGEQVIDNRDETAGVRLYDASMLGSPLLIMIGKKYATDKQVEIEVRKTGQRHFAALDDLTRVVQEIKKSL